MLSDDQVLLSMQYSTQWDALAHVGAVRRRRRRPARLRYYNGYAAGVDVIGPADGGHAGCGCDSGGPSAALKLGIEHLAQKGMQGRGVLVDLERHYGAGRTLIGHAELMRVIEADGIEIEPGDMLVLRTGYAEAVVAMNGQPDADTLHSYGAALDSTDEALLQWITDSGIAAICADNYAVEAYPARERSGPRHAALAPPLPVQAGPAAGRTVVSEGPGRLAARQWPPPLHADRAAAACRTPSARR